MDQMQQISSKKAEDVGIDCNLAEQYAEIQRLRSWVRRAELERKGGPRRRTVRKHPGIDLAKHK
ncbi:hypothetical protein CQ10_09580 [Bradyrhizobium valentinum]|uniref:Uncharacterized protein n=1 Tax=Bradyrhizobium valentinum TaxID=1518501 RepID=A0A0R3M8W9_9BRAD|nr:hypothetical protein CP49_03995 [Bradyrhizobium valentinum]KRR14051.1 hypothetical protein CQ10_09580 [Bradyrhizobium valentinum]